MHNKNQILTFCIHIGLNYRAKICAELAVRQAYVSQAYDVYVVLLFREIFINCTHGPYEKEI